MTSARRDAASRMAVAADRLLASLATKSELLADAAWPFDDEERERWFYTPTDHGGAKMSDLRSSQQRAVMQLLASGLSTAGYVTASTIIGLDNVLDHVEGWSRDWGRERGRDPGSYYVRVFGIPGETGTWSWRFGGHHISINHLIIDGELAGVTPLFLGADPASAPLLGPHPLRPLAGAEDLGRELARSLSTEQRVLGIPSAVAPIDLVGVNRPHFGGGYGDLPLDLLAVWRDEFTGSLAEECIAIQRNAEAAAGLTAENLEAVRLFATPRGLPASALNPSQRELLRALLDVYVHRIPDDLADEHAARYASEADLDSMHFLWTGGLEPGQGHYYRVQGTTLLAEYDNTQRGANHVHTVWRDLLNDFGQDALAAHYRDRH